MQTLSTPVSSRMAPSVLHIGNIGACLRWIDTLPTADESAAHGALAGQLAALKAAAITAPERQKILDALHDTVDWLQAVVAKRFAGKPLPLDKSDAESWQLVISVWHDLAANYRICLNAYSDTELAAAASAPLLIARSLRALEHLLFEHYRVYRQPDPGIWREIHELAMIADQHELLRARVRDDLVGSTADSSCENIYVQALLLDLADPYALSARQLGFVRRWIEKWSPVVTLLARPPAPGATRLLAVDLASNRPAGLAGHMPSSPCMRYLDVEQLGRFLRQTLSLLKQGNTPGQLGLGDDARQPGCEALITLLYVRWCRTALLRNDERHPTDEPATIGFGVWDAWTLVSSNLPPEISESTELSEEQQALLDDLLGQTQPILQWAADCLEKWTILNQSASGFLCALANPARTTRIQHNQLLAVQLKSGKSSVLGMVQWLRIDEHGAFQCGVRLFPGAPQVIMARPASTSLVDQPKFEPALLLPGTDTPETPATIVLPAGWFESGRLIEFKGGDKQFIRLRELLDRGSDFDRGTFAHI